MALAEHVDQRTFVMWKRITHDIEYIRDDDAQSALRELMNAYRANQGARNAGYPENVRDESARSHPG